jgi:hypothetical protein
MDPWEILIWIGSAGFIISLIPQLSRTLKIRRAEDFSRKFLVLVLISSGATLPYMLHVKEYVFAAAQAVNLLVWGTVLYFRLNPQPTAIREPIRPRQKT